MDNSLPLITDTSDVTTETQVSVSVTADDSYSVTAEDMTFVKSSLQIIVVFCLLAIVYTVIKGVHNLFKSLMS